MLEVYFIAFPTLSYFRLINYRHILSVKTNNYHE